MNYRKYTLYVYTVLVIGASTINPSDEKNCDQRPDYTRIKKDRAFLERHKGEYPDGKNPAVQFETRQRQEQLTFLAGAAVLLAGIWTYVWGWGRKPSDAAQTKNSTDKKPDTNSQYNTPENASASSSSSETEVPE